MESSNRASLGQRVTRLFNKTPKVESSKGAEATPENTAIRMEEQVEAYRATCELLRKGIPPHELKLVHAALQESRASGRALKAGIVQDSAKPTAFERLSENGKDYCRALEHLGELESQMRRAIRVAEKAAVADALKETGLAADPSAPRARKPTAKEDPAAPMQGDSEAPSAEALAQILGLRVGPDSALQAVDPSLEAIRRWQASPPPRESESAAEAVVPLPPRPPVSTPGSEAAQRKIDALRGVDIDPTGPAAFYLAFARCLKALEALPDGHEKAFLAHQLVVATRGLADVSAPGTPEHARKTRIIGARFEEILPVCRTAGGDDPGGRQWARLAVGLAVPAAQASRAHRLGR